MKTILIALCLSAAWAAEKAPGDKAPEPIVLSPEQGKAWREIQLMVSEANLSVAMAKIALAEAERAMPEKQKVINAALTKLLKEIGCVGCDIGEVEIGKAKQLVAVKPDAAAKENKK